MGLSFMQRITVKNTDPTGKTSMLDLINDQVKGKLDDNGEPLREVHCQCRGGFCGACKVKVIEGEYVMSDDAFKELCIQKGQTLACSTKMLSDTAVVEFGL